jgi:hypothetical protein
VGCCYSVGRCKSSRRDWCGGEQQLPQAIKAIVAGHDINYQGTWGPIDWDSRGDPTTAVYVIWKHEHGKITILRTITFRR